MNQNRHHPNSGGFACALSALALGLAMTMFAGPAAAQLSEDSDAPIDITGAQFEVIQDQNYALWTGDVQVVQGEVVLTAPQIKFFGNTSGQFNRIEASGGIRYTNGTEAISGEDAVYSKDTGTIVVTGNVVVIQGRQVMTGEKMTYYLDTGRIVFATSGPSRVRGIFYSEEDEAPST